MGHAKVTTTLGVYATCTRTTTVTRWLRLARWRPNQATARTWCRSGAKRVRRSVAVLKSIDFSAVPSGVSSEPRQLQGRPVFFHDYASWAPAAVTTLAGMAQQDEWEYRRASSERPLPILRNYVVYTFRRVYFQGRVAEVTDEGGQKFATFNTGLVTPHFEAIYGYFVEQTSANFPQPWFLQAFVRDSDHRLLKFDKLPERATYFDDPSDLLYDARRELRINYEHVVNDNVDRFPEALRNDQARRTEAVRQAVNHAKFRVEQNYKAAIPQFYWPTRDDSDPGKLQLLLPLCLEDISRADLALSVERAGAVYRAATVLTLDMAYNNARLIARPDKEWLEPLQPTTPDADATVAETD